MVELRVKAILAPALLLRLRTSQPIDICCQVRAQRHSPLFLGFLVFCVLFAEATVFCDVQSVRIILLVFHGCVIATLAITTSQSDYDPVVFLGHCLISSLAFFDANLVLLVQRLGSPTTQKKKTPSQVSMRDCTYIYRIVSTNAPAWYKTPTQKRLY
jgi:hypothetical protein